MSELKRFIDQLTSYEEIPKHLEFVQDFDLLKNTLIEFDQMIGLNDIKNSIVRRIYTIIVEYNQFGYFSNDYFNVMLSGNPGTGKTSTGIIIAKLFKALGVIKGKRENNHVDDEKLHKFIRDTQLCVFYIAMIYLEDVFKNHYYFKDINFSGFDIPTDLIESIYVKDMLLTKVGITGEMPTLTHIIREAKRLATYIIHKNYDKIELKGRMKRKSENSERSFKKKRRYLENTDASPFSAEHTTIDQEFKDVNSLSVNEVSNNATDNVEYITDDEEFKMNESSLNKKFIKINPNMSPFEIIMSVIKDQEELYDKILEDPIRGKIKIKTNKLRHEDFFEFNEKKETANEDMLILDYISNNSEIVNPIINGSEIRASNDFTSYSDIRSIVNNVKLEKKITAVRSLYEMLVYTYNNQTENSDLYKIVTRSDLIGEHIGATAIKTKKIIEECIGGAMIIDEAYSLVVGSEKDFGPECLTEIINFMSQNPRKLVFIFCGYRDKLEHLFESQPGLIRRINWNFDIPDYTNSELSQIFSTSIPKDKKGKQIYTLNINKSEIEEMLNCNKKHFSNNAGDAIKLWTYIREELNSLNYQLLLENKDMITTINRDILEIGISKFINACRKEIRDEPPPGMYL